MMNKMVVANLVHRPTRSFIAMSAIALEVTMILLVVALFYGLLNGSKESQLGVGADLMVMPPGASARHRHVGRADPGQGGRYSASSTTCGLGCSGGLVVHLRNRWKLFTASTWQAMTQLPPKFHYLSGGPFQGPYDVIVDDYFAGMNHMKVGDKIEILNHDFRICGIVPHGKGCRKCLPLATMQDLVAQKARRPSSTSSWIILRNRR